MSEIATTDDKSAEGEAEIRGSVGVRAWFANLVKGSVSAEGSLSVSFKDDTAVKSIVTNTVLQTSLLLWTEGKAMSELKSSITARLCNYQDSSLASLCSLPACRCFGVAKA